MCDLVIIIIANNIIIFSLQIAQTDIGSGGNVEFNTSNTIFTVKRLSPGENYSFRVSAFTTAGEGPTAIVNVTTTTGGSVINVQQ